MQINLQKLQMIGVGVVAIGIISFFLYLGYVVFFTGPKPEESPQLTSINAGSFSGFPKIQKVADAVGGGSKKFFLSKSDYRFVDSAIYKSFTDDPVDVSLTEDRGRDDPFVPLTP